MPFEQLRRSIDGVQHPVISRPSSTSLAIGPSVPLTPSQSRRKGATALEHPSFAKGDPILERESASPETLPQSRFIRYANAIKWFLIDQWFLVSFGLLIILSSQVQVPASRQATKETAVTYAAVAVIFFITGCTLPTRVLIENYSKWKIHLFVQVQW